MGLGGLTRYGRRELILSTLIAGGLCCLAGLLAKRVWPWLWLTTGVPAIGCALVAWFFRDPERSIPKGEGIVLSPADGCVTDVTLLGPESLLGRDGVQIGIFMSVFDVHVNRAPCQGRIDKIERREGTFLDARDQSAWQRNSSATITMTHGLDGAEYPVIVRQIAGLIARRIVTDLMSGQAVAAGERIGMIKFGSRLEVLLPLELAGQVCVHVGGRVKAGQTILAVAKKARTP